MKCKALLGGYALQDQGEDAVRLFTRMQETRVRPNDRTFASVFKACGSMVAMEKATWSDGQSFKEASLEKANVLQEEAENALQLYNDMQDDGVTPDETTFLCLLEACSKLAALSMCNNIVGSGYVWSVTVASAMVHAYGRCGSMVEAPKIFDSYPHHNVFTCTALIAGYAHWGDTELSLQAFQEMQRMGMRPNSVTFVPILSACSHTRMLAQGMVYFEYMSRDYGLIPTTEHYVSIQHSPPLGRAGLFDEADFNYAHAAWVGSVVVIAWGLHEVWQRGVWKTCLQTGSRCRPQTLRCLHPHAEHLCACPNVG